MSYSLLILKINRINIGTCENRLHEAGSDVHKAAEGFEETESVEALEQRQVLTERRVNANRGV